MISLLQTLLRRGESLSIPIKANSLGEKAYTHFQQGKEHSLDYAFPSVSLTFHMNSSL